MSENKPIFLIAAWANDMSSISDEDFNAIQEEIGDTEVGHEVFAQWYANAKRIQATFVSTTTPDGGEPTVFTFSEDLWDAASLETGLTINNTAHPYPRNAATSNTISPFLGLYLNADHEIFAHGEVMPFMFVRNKRFHAFQTTAFSDLVTERRIGPSEMYLKTEFEIPGSTTVEELTVTITETFY